MAQIDPRIAMGFAPTTQIEQPVNTLARILQAEGLKQQNQLGQMKMDEYRSGVERKNKLASLLGGQYGTDEERESALLRGGFIDEAQQLQKGRNDALKARADVGKTTADTEKIQIQTAMDKVGAIAQILQGVNSPETYAQALQAGANIGLDVSKLPQQYDPVQVQQSMARALTVQQQLEQQWKQKGYDLDVRKQGETERNNQVQNRISQGQLGVAQGNLGLRRQELELNRQQGPAGKPPAGYRWTPDGALEPIPGGPGAQRAAEVGFKQSERNDAKDAKRAAISAQIAVVDKALAHPGRATSTGLSGTIDPRNYIPGTDAADFRAVLDQIGGTAFLQAFESLKGGGQITEVEGKKATDAIARLSRAQSDKEFEQSLRDLREVMVSGQKRLGDQTGGAQTAPADASNIDALLEKYK